MTVAERVARLAHAGQIDRDGRPHIEHVLAVAARFPDGSVERQVALLHDVLEDSDWRAADLLRAGLDGQVVGAVLTLTRRRDERYADYVERVARSGRPAAVRVKLADLQHNLSRSRAAGWSSLSRRYEAATEALSGLYGDADG